MTGERFYYLPHDKPASAPLPRLPAGWSKLVSKGTGATYFLHTDGASQFEMPSEPAEDVDITELLESNLPKKTGPSAIVLELLNPSLRRSWRRLTGGGS